MRLLSLFTLFTLTISAVLLSGLCLITYGYAPNDALPILAVLCLLVAVITLYAMAIIFKSKGN